MKWWKWVEMQEGKTNKTKQNNRTKQNNKQTKQDKILIYQCSERFILDINYLHR